MSLTLGNEVQAWVEKKLQGEFGPAQAIGWKRKGVLIAGAVFEKHNGANVYMHIALDGTFIPPTFMAAIMDYPFNQLKVKRITGIIADSNEASKEFARHLGARLEGVMVDALPNGNLCIYGLLRKDACRWLIEPLQRRLGAYRGHRSIQGSVRTELRQAESAAVA
jgi:hypothetical protein